MDEIKELLNEEENQEQPEKEIQDKKRILDALEKAISVKKQEIYELRETLRELKNENLSLIEKLKQENTEVALEEFSSQYNVSDEEKNIIKSALEENPPEAISKEKLLRQIKSIYLSLHPEIIEKLEEEKKQMEQKIKTSEVVKQQLTEKQIKTTSSYEPTAEEEEVELTPEELEFIKEYDISPEYYKKSKKFKKFTF